MGGILDAMTGGALWGIGFALAVGVTRSGGQGLRMLTKAVMKGGFAVADHTREVGDGVNALYAEANAERRRVQKKRSVS